MMVGEEGEREFEVEREKNIVSSFINLDFQLDNLSIGWS